MSKATSIFIYINYNLMHSRVCLHFLSHFVVRYISCCLCLNHRVTVKCNMMNSLTVPSNKHWIQVFKGYSLPDLDSLRPMSLQFTRGEVFCVLQNSTLMDARRNWHSNVLCRCSLSFTNWKYANWVTVWVESASTGEIQLNSLITNICLRVVFIACQQLIFSGLLSRQRLESMIPIEYCYKHMIPIECQTRLVEGKDHWKWTTKLLP